MHQYKLAKRYSIINSNVKASLRHVQNHDFPVSLSILWKANV